MIEDVNGIKLYCYRDYRERDILKIKLKFSVFFSRVLTLSRPGYFEMCNDRGGGL